MNAYMTKVVLKDGKAEITVPEGFPDGEVNVMVERIAPDAVNPEMVWTDEEWAEVQELLKPNPNPKSGKEFAEWITSDKFDSGDWSEITDSLEWVLEQRRKVIAGRMRLWDPANRE